MKVINGEAIDLNELFERFFCNHSFRTTTLNKEQRSKPLRHFNAKCDVKNFVNLADMEIVFKARDDIKELYKSLFNKNKTCMPEKIIDKANEVQNLFTLMNMVFVYSLVREKVINLVDVDFYQGFSRCKYTDLSFFEVFENLSNYTMETLGFYVYKDKYVIDVSMCESSTNPNITFLDTPDNIEYYGLKEKFQLSVDYEIKLHKCLETD